MRKHNVIGFLVGRDDKPLVCAGERMGEHMMLGVNVVRRTDARDVMILMLN